MSDLRITPKDCWRGIILLGLNTATYKVALATCLLSYSDQGKTFVSMDELANDFFDIYLARLQNGRPQLNLPGRLTVMERILEQYKLGKLSRERSILRVKAEAFNDVISRFHTVDNAPVPTVFYQYSQEGLSLTDEVHKVLCGPNRLVLENEVQTRWDLLEAAFEINRSNFKLENDIRKFYLDNGYERTDITKLRPALNSYQNGSCFYCGEEMASDEIHVDHVIPRQLINHDDVWNLVLAHEFCNTQKSDLLPSIYYIEQLIYRNDFLIKSNHPLKDKIIEKLGINQEERRRTILGIYNQAQLIMKHTWEGLKGYNPRTDPLYHLFVKR